MIRVASRVSCNSVDRGLKEFAARRIREITLSYTKVRVIYSAFLIVHLLLPKVPMANIRT